MREAILRGRHGRRVRQDCNKVRETTPLTVAKARFRFSQVSLRTCCLSLRLARLALNARRALTLSDGANANENI
eukprot:493106-Pyramimonas_sp.AAC.1